MGQIFGITVVMYLIGCAAIVPVVMAQSYLAKRDCEVVHAAPCVWVMQPLDAEQEE